MGRTQGRILARGTMAWVGLLVGCSGPETARIVGLLNGSPARTATVDLPAIVVAGRPFTVTVTTYGSSNCTRSAGERVMASGALVRVVPLDEVALEGACRRDLAPFVHRHSLQLEMLGPAVLRVVGYFGQGAEQVLDSVDVPVQVGP